MTTPESSGNEFESLSYFALCESEEGGGCEERDERAEFKVLMMKRAKRQSASPMNMFIVCPDAVAR